MELVNLSDIKGLCNCCDDISQFQTLIEMDDYDDDNDGNQRL